MNWRTIPAAVMIFFLSCNNEQESINPVETTITESVYASVVIQPDSLYQAFAVVNGILDRILVEEGDTVKKRRDPAGDRQYESTIGVQKCLFSLTISQRKL